MTSRLGSGDALAALLSVAEGLDVMVSVQRAIDAAMSLTGARYGAIGLFGPDGRVSEFIYRGITDEHRARIGPLPQGRGLLGVLARQKGPLRLASLADHPASVGFPAHHPPMTTLLGAPIIVGTQPFGSFYLTDKEGGLPFSEDDESLVSALAAAVAVAVRNNRSFERTRQRERWQRSATAIDYAVLSGSAPVEVLESIAAEARRLSGADVGLVALPDAEGRLVIEIVDVRNVRAVGEARWSVDRSIRHDTADGAHLEAVCGWLGRVCTEDCLMHASFATGQTMLAPGLDAAPHGAPAADSFATAVSIPMRTPERSLGVLCLLWDHEVPRLSDASLEVADSFAAQAAVTLMLAEARREYETLLVFRDRDRIARDMHDLVVQRVFATGMSLQGILRSTSLPDVVAARVERAITDLDETITEIRRTIFELHAPGALPPALRVRVQRELVQATVLLGFAPDAHIEGELDTLPPSVADHLLAALREGLSNAARHAQAGRVEVRICVDEAAAQLTVTDDGIGPPRTLTRQSGVANLASRAAQLGGASGIAPGPDGVGCCLSWRVPLRG